MNFKFFPTESRIYDFLKFPRLLYFRESMENTDNIFQKLSMENYLTFVKTVEEKLKHYSSTINKFYMKEFFHDYDFIDLVSRLYTFFGCKNEEEYLDILMSLNEKEINTALIYSFIIINEDYHKHSENLIRRAEEIGSDKNNFISFIKDLPIESGAKWNLFLIIEEPMKYMGLYVDLMKSLLPIFREHYSPYQMEISTYGEKLVGFLNKEGAKGLEEITYSIIDPKVIDFEETNVFISLVYSYAISMNTASKSNFIAWGLKMEESFKVIKEVNENKTNERIQVFKNLGDKTRYEVLKLIASGETSVKVIAEELNVSSATISYHINNLLTSKIIKMDKIEGKYGYVVDYKFLDNIINGFQKDILKISETNKGI